MAEIHVFSGLGSGVVERYREGMETLAKRINGSFYASFSGYADWQEVADWIIQRRGSPVILGGHSNGGYAVLKIAEKLAAHGIKVDYIFVVDCTLKPCPNAGGNVKLLHDYWAGLRKVERGADFTGAYEFFDLDDIEGRNVMHVEAASLPFVHNTIATTVAKLKPSTPKEPAMNEMQITARVALEVATHEGLVKEAYRDSVGVLTWSVGVTSASGHNVDRYIGNPQTIERCLEIYLWLLETKYAPAVRKAFAGRSLTEAQFAAALSFHWNTGSIDDASWVDNWKAGEIGRARANFMNWRIPPEVIPRRRKELELFFDGKWSGDGTIDIYGGVSGNMKPTNPQRVNIRQAMQAAIDKAGKTPVDGGVTPPSLPVPETPKPPVVAPVGDLDAFLQGRYPDTEPEARQRAAMLADAIAYRLSPNPPSAGFSLPTSQGNSEMKSFLQSKTIWGVATMVIANVLPTVLPVLGYEFTSADAQSLLGAVQTMVEAAGAILAIYGRVVAKDALTLIKA